MKYLFLLLSFLFTLNLTSQSDYHFFQPEQQYLFENEDAFVDITNSKLTGIKVDEAECAELYRTILVMREEACPVTGFEHLIVPSFAGLRICQTADSIIMSVGKENDVVILQHAVLGESWGVTIEESILVVGRVDSIHEVEIGGIIDSVKFINFFKGDTLLLDEPVELSKSNGLIKAAYFWGLLSMRETLNRIDEETVGIPDWESIYSFEVGDEYHVRSTDTEYRPSTNDFLFHFKQEIFRVLSVVDSSGYRLVNYSSDILAYSSLDYSGQSGTMDTALIFNQSIRASYKVDFPAFLNKQPGAMIESPPSFGFGLISVVRVGGRCLGGRKSGGYPLENRQLYNYAGYIFDLPDVETYISNSGGPYYFFGDQDGSIYERELKYANHSGSTCFDTPFDFSGITNVEYVEDVPGVDIYPNPADRIINVTSSEEPVSMVSLYNIAGRMVLRQEVNVNAVDVSDLPAGVYNLVVHFGNGKKLNKKIVVL